MPSHLHPSAGRVASAWMCHVAKATYKDYVEQKKKDGEKPLTEDEWKDIVEGVGGEGNTTERVKPRRAPTPTIEDLAKDDTGPVGDVIQAVKTKKNPTRELVQKAIALVQERIESFAKGSSVSKKEQEATKDLHTWLKEFLGMGEEKTTIEVNAPVFTGIRSKSREDGSSLSESQTQSLGEYAQAMSKKEDEAKKILQNKKNIYERDRAAIIARLKKHGLGVKDLSDMQAHAAKLRKQYEKDKKKDSKIKEPDYHAEWKKENPKSKLPKKDFEAALGLPDQEPQERKKTPAEIKRDFLKNVKDPDDKAAFEDMDDEEFMAALQSIMGKKGSLQRQVVRMAYLHPDLRNILLLALGRL